MMRIPIPDDWDGQNWRCVRVEWPDSPQWLALLRGLLSTPARGRWWDERSGIVTDAQATGREIYRRNWNFDPCDAQEGPPESDAGEGIDGSVYGAVCAWLERENVGILDIEIRGNELWVRRLPCCEWEQVGEFAVTGGFEDSPWEGDGMPPPSYSACGRAYAIVQKMYDLSTTVWDARSQFPWNYVSYIKGQHPDLVGGDIFLFEAVLQTELIVALGGEDVVTDPSKKQNILCRIESQLSASGDALTDTEWGAVKGAFSGEFAGSPIVANYWGMLYAAIGRGDMSRIAVAGATDNTQDCRCPAQIGDPTDSWPESNTWEHWFDLTGQALPAAIDVEEGAHVPGVGVRAYGDQGDLSHPAVDIDFATETGQIRLVYLRYRLGDGLDYTGTKVLVGTDPAGLAALSDTGDTDPSAGGTYTIQKIVSHQLTASDNRLYAKVEADDVSGSPSVERAVVLEAIGFAGTGADPLS